MIQVKRNWFLWISLIFLALATLIPKVPLFEIIPGYIVRGRIEDVLLSVVLGVFAMLLARQKVTVKTPLTRWFVFYAVVGVLVMLNAMFVLHTLPLNTPHILKMVLHFLRRLEYFSVFFLFFNAVKNRRDLRIFILVLSLIFMAVIGYGYGQKYLQWPVYSTMNREFSKGEALVLDEFARVPSTFGGHYDMAAFAMFILTILLSFIFFSRKKLTKISLITIFVSGFWLLILGSSRSSFLAYLLSASSLVVLVAYYRRSIKWGISRYIVVMAFSLSVLMLFGDLSERFSQLGFVMQFKNKLYSVVTTGKQPTATIVPTTSPVDKTDQRPVPVIKKSTPVPIAIVLPPDVYKNIPDKKTITATEGGKIVTKVVEVGREFSMCSYVYGLSACIRFESLWPRAVNGFLRNPFLGSGFSTLTKAKFDEFSEAESTDNDFLRNLGESGVLGVIGFYGPMFYFVYRTFKFISSDTSREVVALNLGIVAGILGMFLNANYIDVFEASKVAFMFWAVLGVGFASMEMDQKKL